MGDGHAAKWMGRTRGFAADLVWEPLGGYLASQVIPESVASGQQADVEGMRLEKGALRDEGKVA